MRYLTITFLTLLIAAFLVGCSTSSDMIAPSTDRQDLDIALPILGESDAGHALLGAWYAEFDLEALTVDIQPMRELDAHMNITSMLPYPVITVVSYDSFLGIMQVDAQITNNYTIDGYDLRLIIFTDNYGNRLRNPDAWTTLHDISGGTPVNPFKAYAKNVAQRKFAGQTSHTERLQLYFPAGYTGVQFAIDASYPSNCEEPYEIKNFTQGILYDTTTIGTDITVEVYDWQNDTNSVMLYCPAILSYGWSLGQKTTTVWGGKLFNVLGASAGTYTGYIEAKSANSGNLALYNPVTITVTEVPKNGWAKTWGGAQHDQATELAIDSYGNVYVCGFFDETVDFDPGPLTVNYTANSDRDIFLSKFTPRGDLAWARHWDIYCRNPGSQVAVDSKDNVYITGGATDIRKYSPTGDIHWTTTVTDAADNYGIAINSSDQIHIAGQDDDYTAYICRFDEYGNAISESRWGSDGSAGVYELAFNSYDECFAVGSFKGTVDFDPGTGVNQKVSFGYPYGYSDAFLVKYWSNGNFASVQTWGNISAEPPVDVALTSSGEPRITGFFDLQSDFDPGPGNFDLTSNGYNDVYLSIFMGENFLLAQSWGGTGEDRSFAITTDPNNNIIVVGYFNDTVDFDPGTGIDTKTAFGNGDIFVSKLSSYGTYQWVRTFGSTGYDVGLDVETDFWGNIYVSGTFQGQVDFNPGSGNDDHNAVGLCDAFLLKLLPNGNWE